MTRLLLQRHIFGLDQVCSILPALELLPLYCSRRRQKDVMWTVEGEQLQRRQSGSNLIYFWLSILSNRAYSANHVSFRDYPQNSAAFILSVML